MKLFLAGAAAVVLVATTTFAADQAWTGQISDNMCGAKHEETAEGQGKMPDPECTKACIKGGSKYVFVSEGKVYKIVNQDAAGLETHAGHTVKLTGAMNGDSLTVSKIEMVASKDESR